MSLPIIRVRRNISYMETLFENAKVIQDRHHYEPVRKCPKCNSVFISDMECESCNYQLHFDLLGEPLGLRSFYTLKENYWNDLSSVSKIHHSFEKKSNVKYESYKRKILLRYNVLLDYFYDSSRSLMDTNRALFLQELKDTILELMQYGVAERTIWRKVDEATNLVDNVSVTPLYQKIAMAIKEGKVLQNDRKELSESILDYKVLSFFRLSTVIISILGFAICITLAIFTYKYQTLMS